MEQKINLLKQTEWEAGPDEELKIPEGYIKQLRYEIVVIGRKTEKFAFRCKNYERTANGEYEFKGVIIDTSKKNPKGEIELKRLTYHPELVLVNVPFMAIPAPPEAGADAGS